jgi:hypothetical protein
MTYAIGQTFPSYDAALTAIVAEWYGATQPATGNAAAEAAEIKASGWLDALEAEYGEVAEGAVEGIIAELERRANT